MAAGCRLSAYDMTINKHYKNLRRKYMIGNMSSIVPVHSDMCTYVSTVLGGPTSAVRTKYAQYLLHSPLDFHCNTISNTSLVVTHITIRHPLLYCYSISDICNSVCLFTSLFRTPSRLQTAVSLFLAHTIFVPRLDPLDPFWQP